MTCSYKVNSKWFQGKVFSQISSGVVLEIGCKWEIFAARVAVNRKPLFWESLFVLFVQGNR